MLSINKFELRCRSKVFQLDKDLIPLPLPPGGTATTVFNVDIDDGDECRLFIEAVGEGGYRMAASSALIPVRSV